MGNSFLETESPGSDDSKCFYKSQKLNYASFSDARKFVKQLSIQSLDQWKEYCRGELAGKDPKPYYIPSNPELHYRFDGWKSWEDWLGQK